LLKGYKIVKEISEKIGKEIKYVGVREDKISLIMDCEFKDIVFPLKSLLNIQEKYKERRKVMEKVSKVVN